jgi:hypothetical protein
MYKQKAELELMGKNGRNFILNNFTREVGTNKYIALMKKMIKF